MKLHKQKNISLCGFGKVPCKSFYKVNPMGFWFPTKTYDGIKIRHDLNNGDLVKESDKLVNKILKFNIRKK